MFGILNLYKPAGITSRAAVNCVQRCLPRKTKVGHAGTLDPIAQGVLVVCVGPATRLIPYIHQYSKTYHGTFQLGQSSPTEDIEGELTPVPIPEGISQESFDSLRSKFTGLIEQVPPKFSAVKVQGQRAYDVARRGGDFELIAKTVQIHQLDLTYEQPELSMVVECGTGTYIRSLGRDIAQRLGTEAVMSNLKRVAIGPYSAEDSENMESLTPENLKEKLCSPLTALSHLQRFVADEAQVDDLTHGRRINLEPHLLEPISVDAPLVIVDQAGTLIALAIEKKQQLAPHIVFPTAT